MIFFMKEANNSRTQFTELRNTPMKQLRCIDLGRREYQDVLRLQQRLVERLREDPAGPAHLLLVEHDPPVITLGRGADRSNVLVDSTSLQAAGVELHEISRGGDVTWHGPGQLVGYPIVSLKRGGQPVHGYVARLEEAIIGLLDDFGIQAHRREGFPGVWLGTKKIAAIGVAVDHWVCYHGFALNIAAELPGFELIRPCGIGDSRQTSISRELGRDVSLKEVKAPLLKRLAEQLRMEPVPADEASLTPKENGSRLPEWFRKPLPAAGESAKVRRLVDRLGLHTVCTSAHCPNLSECFARGTATFLILGDRCTRGCRFCAVESASPLPPRSDEPQAVAEAVSQLELRHVVITSVTRDDLPDGGASHFAATINAVRRLVPNVTIEVLTPDFRGEVTSVRLVMAATPEVFNHNVETVPRLYDTVRPGADYERSLEVLRLAREPMGGTDTTPRTKSGLMLGLGESAEEVKEVLADLRRVGCDALTIGQYLAPSKEHLPVERFVPPEEFETWRRRALQLGFVQVTAGPMVRSSYNARAIP